MSFRTWKMIGLIALGFGEVGKSIKVYTQIGLNNIEHEI